MVKKTKFKPAPLPANAELVSLKEATQRLGRGYSRRSILRRIDSGEWEEGKHWIDDRSTQSSKRIIKVNLTAINELRAIPAAYR